MKPFLRKSIEYLEKIQQGTAKPYDAKIHHFLADLQLIDINENLCVTSEIYDHCIRMLRAGLFLENLIPIRNKNAPNFVMLGGIADPQILKCGFTSTQTGSVTGSGTDFSQAFFSCTGEGIEFLSQFEQIGDLTPQSSHYQPLELQANDRDQNQFSDYVKGRNLSDGTSVNVPAARCLRRKNVSSTPYALSTGCGTGITLEKARFHAILELVERDAYAMWWLGGKFGRPLDMNSAGLLSAIEFLQTIRDANASRVSWLLDIRSDLDIPCVAAISSDRDGKNVACGTAAHLTLEAAAKAAIREMCQMEMAYDVVQMKLRERGEMLLNATDRRHIDRAENLSAADCALLHPQSVPNAAEVCPFSPVSDDTDPIIEHIAEHSIQLIEVDLTRPQFQVPSVRIISPELQLFPSAIITPRLQNLISEFGGGSRYTDDIALH